MGRTGLVVVSFGSHALLARHLARTADGLDAEVVVVDAWSGAGERADVARLADTRGWHLVPLAGNPGFGAGVNAGVVRAREIGCDVVVVLNPDLAVDAATVTALAQAAREDPAALVGPRVLRPDGSVWSTGGTLDVRTGRTTTPRERPARVDWLTGACLAASTALWERVGGFDERYFLYWEDVDLSWRVRAAGGRLVLRDDLTAVHEVGGTQATAGGRAKSSAYYRHNVAGRLLFAAAHVPRATAWAWLASTPGYARAVVLRGGARQLLRSPAPVLAAARGALDGAAAVLHAGRAHAPARSADAARAADGPRRLLLAHPSPDLYGSDRQMLESVEAAVAGGWSVRVVLPSDGPLVPELERRGAEVHVTSFPVLRKALLHPRRALGFARASLASLRSLTASLRAAPPDLLYVNTVTIPVWLAAGRLAGVRVLCHVHEAEDDQGRLVGTALVAPLALAHRVVANSAAARASIERRLPAVGRRVAVLHNGVPGPDAEPAPPAPHAGPARLALVARLSPRKGVDVALEAVGLLAAQGRDVHVDVCGTTFPGYEWYEDELRERAQAPDLRGRVTFHGYVRPTWPLLERADVVLVPSRVEPFGNTAVEGLLARRPVVASRTQGLAEVVRDGVTGLLVPPDDAAALAAASARVLDDPDLARALADAGRRDALARFSTQGYAEALRDMLDAALSPGRRFG